MRSSPLERIGRLAAGTALVVGLALHASLGTAQDEAAVTQAKGLSRAFQAAAKKVLPTVVEVKTASRPNATIDGEPPKNPFKGTPFEDLFPEQAPGFNGGDPEERQLGLGSGVIIDPAGVVLTNNHVIDGADKVVVRLSDGREFEATDVKVDPQTDLAVMRIKADEPLPAAPLGDSDKLEIGDWVLAVGNPFELEGTVSAGIISAKGRTLGAVGRARFLQTDAAINPGNSGGPLVNLDGEVVGINTAIFSRSGGYQGIGFAVPVNLAKWVAPQLLAKGKVQRAYLGVAIGKIAPARAAELGIRPTDGVLIERVFDDSPAAQAGLKENDVVLSFDGTPVRAVSELQDLVEKTPLESTHDLQVLRDGKPLGLKIVVRGMPDDFSLAESRPRPGGPTAMFRSKPLGLTVIDLSDAVAAQLGLRGRAGALVIDVEAGRPAFRGGVREGMLITRVGEKAVRNAAEFSSAIESVSIETGVKLEVETRRGKQEMTIKAP